MRWRSSRPGRAARQIVCRCPTPQPGQRSSTITAAGGTAGDGANEAVSPNATMSETETTSTEIPIGDGDVDLGSTRDDTGPAPAGDWSLSVDSPLALGGGDCVSGTGNGPAAAANRDRHNANRSPRSRWAKSPYCRIRTSLLGMMCSANRGRENGTSLIVDCLSGPAWSAECEAQPQPRGGRQHPLRCSQWVAPSHALPHHSQLFLRQAGIDQGYPVPGALHGPRAQDQVVAVMGAPPEGLLVSDLISPK